MIYMASLNDDNSYVYSCRIAQAVISYPIFFLFFLF